MRILVSCLMIYIAFCSFITATSAESSFVVAPQQQSQPSLQTSEKKKRDKEKRTRQQMKQTQNPVLQPIEDQAGLPRVLLIGDSISMGYTLPVRKKLAGVANVHRPPINCGPTTRGLEHLNTWLGEEKWDVIHFNWGLHDLKYVKTATGPNLADPADPASSQQVPLKQYEQNLNKLVKQLKTTGAKLVWAATTPVPEGARGRVAGDSLQYNAVAKRIMAEHNIQINDLHALTSPRLKTLQRPADVHFNREGSDVLANQVSQFVKAALAQRALNK